MDTWGKAEPPFHRAGAIEDLHDCRIRSLCVREGLTSVWRSAFLKDSVVVDLFARSVVGHHSHPNIRRPHQLPPTYRGAVRCADLVAIAHVVNSAVSQTTYSA